MDYAAAGIAPTIAGAWKAYLRWKLHDRLIKTGV